MVLFDCFRMASCQFLLLLVAGSLALTSGKPLDSSRDKRDSPSHHVIQVLGPSHSSEFSMSHPEAPSSLAGNPLPRAGVQSADIHSSDHNGIPQMKQTKNKPLPKLTDQTSKRPAGEGKGSKKGKKSNSDLFHHLGMAKLRSPSVNHHRKRLASQSRKTHHQKSTSDSKMFVIKLPPNPYYYSHHNLNGIDVLEPQPKSVSNVPVNFNTNGKPSRVYHWNIPVIKKMVARKAGSSKSAVFADSDIFSIDKQATWNETDDDKSIYRKATYYGPKKPSKHAFRKYFAGNGKPHSFYVMEKSKKPATVHRLLP